jgi:hypothetical protein
VIETNAPRTATEPHISPSELNGGLGAWISVEDSRPKQNALLAVLLKNSGKYAIRRGCYYEKYEEETYNEDFFDHNEADDTDYVPEGWYEAIANWDEWTTVSINEGMVTHWMPLPEAPNVN